jgi:hypothetical protein
MASWSEYGLPPLLEGGYSYSINAGIIRTPFETARPRQRRLFATNQHTYKVSAEVTQEQLTTAEWFLTSFGFSWFELALTDAQGKAATRLVRAISDYSVAVKGHDLYVISFDLESFVETQETSIFAFSWLYPLPGDDDMTATPPNWPKSILEMYDREETHRPITAVAVPDDPVAVENEGYDFMATTPPDVPTAA